MLLNFLDELRAAGIPASVKEHLVLLEALDGTSSSTPESFYYLARATYREGRRAARQLRSGVLKVFKGVLLRSTGRTAGDIPEDWLRRSPRNSSRPKKWRRSSRWETGTRSWRR
jgi:uncharacterized protein with von Willebrand factor type A (vWA) domain